MSRKLALWRRDGGTDGSRVILVAHSMGGLVAQYFLEALEGWRDCRALVTFGTPYRGSVNAVDVLANGLRPLGVDLSAPLRSFPSVYQLLPRYAMIGADSGSLRVRGSGRGPGARSDAPPGAFRAARRNRRRSVRGTRATSATRRRVT